MIEDAGFALSLAALGCATLAGINLLPILWHFRAGRWERWERAMRRAWVLLVPTLFLLVAGVILLYGLS